MYKFFVFCPHDDALIETIVDAATDAGAGRIGQYTHCAFITPGFSSWKNEIGTNPTIGKVGDFQVEEEVRIEMECPKNKMSQVAAAIKQVHPYETVVIDAIPMERY